jgi:hypothetical protein
MCPDIPEIGLLPTPSVSVTVKSVESVGVGIGEEPKMGGAVTVTAGSQVVVVE